MLNSLVTAVSLKERRPSSPATTGEWESRDRLREGFGAEAVAPRHRLTFVAIGLTLCLVFGITFSHANLPMTALPAFVPAYLTAVIVTELITAYLLFVHTPLSRRFDLLWLAGAYLFSSAMASGQLMVFPGVLALNGLFGAGSQSAVWIWVLWHGGFPTMVIVAMLVSWRTSHAAPSPISVDSGGGTTRFMRPRTRHGLMMASFVLCVAVIFETIVTRFHASLPILINGRSFSGLAHSITGQIVLTLNAIALVLVLRVTRCRSVLDLGLAIAVLASTLDAGLTLKAGARFSLGWYIARAGSVVTAVSVLIVFLREVTLLYARVIRLNEKLAEQAAVDVTTELFNRRHFNRQLHVTLRDAARRRETTALLLIDIDHFKLFNDRYGHLAGDDCLHQVAQTIAGAIRRPSDIAARYGGEEFAVILPTTSPDGARHIAQRVLTAIRSLGVDHAASPTSASVTVSIGVGMGQPGTRFEELIRASDDALYTAKRAGRDRVSVA
jgi:diguanylate cyclase (GGDEF)-like protein